MAFRGRILCALTFSGYTCHLHFIMFLNKDSLWNYVSVILVRRIGCAQLCLGDTFVNNILSFWNNRKYFGVFFGTAEFFLRPS